MVMNKKGFAFPLIFLLIASGLALMYFSGNLPTGALLQSEDFIQAPYFAKVYCDQADVASSFTGTVSESGEWISDKLPKNTDEWSVTLTESPGSNFPAGARFFKYYVCPQRSIESNCRPIYDGSSSDSSSNFVNIPVTSSNEFIFAQQFEYRFILKYPESGGTFKVTYKPYELRRDDAFRGGDQKVADALGCQIPYTDPAWQERILSATGIIVPDGTAKTRDLRPNEKFNYISGTVTRLAEGNTQDGGYCVYSNGKGNIYPIAQLTTPKTVYNIVDVTKSPIKTVQCCNGDNLPDKTCVNGNWVSTVNAQCSFLNPCEGTEWRADLNNIDQAIRYACVQGQCQAQTKEVSCTISSQCSTNQVCDPNTFTCVQASIAGGAGEDRIPTTEAECQQKGWNWKPQETKKKGFSIIGIGFGETVVVDAHCEKPASTLKTILWIAGVSFAIFLFILLRPLIFGIFRSLRGFLKGIPFIGRFFP